MFVDFSRCQITHPDGLIPRGRFVYRNGTAAVWVEDHSTRTAHRVLFATGATFEKQPTRRVPHYLHLAESGESWSIIQQTGGCGCGSRMKAYSVEDLLDPDRTTI